MIRAHSLTGISEVALDPVWESYLCISGRNTRAWRHSEYVYLIALIRWSASNCNCKKKNDKLCIVSDFRTLRVRKLDHHLETSDSIPCHILSERLSGCFLRKQHLGCSVKLALMSYNRGGLTPMPGMELGMPAQPIYVSRRTSSLEKDWLTRLSHGSAIQPGVRIGGSDMPGAFTLQVVHPNGQTINVEIGDLSRPLSAASSHGTYVASASGPVREGLSRPSSDHMRRRASSVASSSGMEYNPFNGGGHNHGFHQGNPLPPQYRSNHPHHKQPLIDRVGAMNLNDRMSNNSSPMPDLTRSDPSTSFNSGSGRGGFGGDNFSRPNSRMSNRSYNQPPYARPNSSNSFRSNGSFQSNGFRPRGRDGFYPKYNPDSKTNVGSYPV